jgi:hypothetical protein
MTRHAFTFLSVAFCFVAARAVAALGDESFIAFTPQVDGVAIVENKTAAPLVVDAADWPGVRRATSDLQADIERVSAERPEIVALSGVGGVPSPRKTAVIIGTLGRSPLITELVRTGKIDVAPIAGRWEAFLLQVVEQPLPGVERALVIAGSDKRGTIYGIYELSQQIGVSPWYWWADVPVIHRDVVYASSVLRIETGPAVRYRGIFLNDEYPNLTKWVSAKFGAAPERADPPVPAGVANYGREFQARLFEVMLRLRANYLWPAMWNNAFNEDDSDNARLADEYGIVMGTSHQEPMLRAQKEWDRRYKATLGSWNYTKHPDVLQNFWREGVRRNREFESIITMGLRGADDTEMAPGGPEANRALLEKIVDVQRGILREEINPDLSKVPQVWCLYKEVQDFYEHGMRVPDDVTLLWAEDNWGNVRRLPTAEERKRSGGAGVYYHFDYHGSPRSYQWLNTSPLPKIWDQLSLAHQYGADRVWIVNVGHFKGYELPLEFFLNLAWKPSRWNGENLDEFTHRWARREFGPAYADAIADLLARYTKYNARRKPELLAPDTYSLVHYLEAETVFADWSSLSAQAEEINAALPPEKRDAFYQLVLFPAKAGKLVNGVYLAAARNALFAKQSRTSANLWAGAAHAAFQQYLGMVTEYHTKLAGGKWDHFMDQTVLGYTSWNDPPVNSLNHLKFTRVTPEIAAKLGVAVEGSDSAWPGAKKDPLLPRFDTFSRRKHYIDVFNRGNPFFAYTATASAPWILLSATQGSVSEDQRLWVDIDWTRVPEGLTTGTVKISGAGATVTVKLEAFAPAGLTREKLRGFVESEGHVSIEAAHFTRNTPVGTNRWALIEDYGHTLSGLRAEGPADVLAAPGKDSPCLEYELHLFTSGPAAINAITGPTLSFIPNRPVRYAVALDDEAPQVVILVPAGFSTHGSNQDWGNSVKNNAHTGRSKHKLARSGPHTLKIWMIDPGVVLQKLVVDLGGVKPSYLGPPESYRAP